MGWLARVCLLMIESLSGRVDHAMFAEGFDVSHSAVAWGLGAGAGTEHRGFRHGRIAGNNARAAPTSSLWGIVSRAAGSHNFAPAVETPSRKGAESVIARARFAPDAPCPTVAKRFVPAF